MLHFKVRKDIMNKRGDGMNENLETDDIWITEFDSVSAIEFHAKVKQKFSENGNSPIIIYINSNGGEVSSLMSMMDTMDSFRTMNPNLYFVTYVTGSAYSAAADLLAHGDYRVASPNSSIMIHQTNSLAMGHIEDMEAATAETRRLNDHAATIFMNNIRHPGGLEAYKKLAIYDTFLSPEQALEMNIVDFVGYLQMEQINVSRPKVDDGKSLKLRKKQIQDYISTQKQPVKRKTKKEK